MDPRIESNLFTWATFLPVSLVLALSICSIRYPRLVIAAFRFLSRPWTTFLSLSEARAYELDGGAVVEETEVEKRAPLWFTVLLVVVAAVEAIAWTVVAAFTVARGGPDTVRYGFQAAILSVTWVYAAIKPIANPKGTPSYDLLALYVLHLIGAIILLGGVLYDHNVHSVPNPPSAILAAYSVNLALIVSLILAMINRPMGILALNADKSDGPEDYTTLWQWMSLGWIDPLVKQGTYRTLNENDVSNLSPTMRAKPVFLKFNALKRSSLLRQLWAANSVDVSIDVALHFVNIVLNYTVPFFLKRIIDAIEDPTPEHQAQAYIYAFLMFCSTMLRAEVEIQHLWFGRRGSVRIRSELMSAIYDKALKRKDFSGIVEGTTKNDSGELKAGADLGKIVNLMSVDVSQFAQTVNWIYWVCSGPFEVILAGTFLYQLLGLSAFAGFIALLMTWPLNSIVARQTVGISKGLLTARDKRMSVLNEVIGMIKLIKFFAWEDRWIQRVLDAREHELKWLMKSRVNTIILQALWTASPILVSVISLMVFVARGNELTLGVAFTSILLFKMIRYPLSTIPNSVVQMSQAYIQLQRIETFLNEDEVDDSVSSIKGTSVNAGVRPAYSEFGLRNAALRWNTIEEKAEGIKLKSQKSRDPARSDSNDTATVEATIETNTERTFELSDISIAFPEGELSVVTGPTASGKTALLLSLLGEMTLLPGGEILMYKEPEKVDEHGFMHAISYAAQTPWLQHQSIKENILFGSPFDEDRYKAVVEGCALAPDLKILEDGDETEIGARGVSLSGGQKARVALARAVYARTKYVLLDDPLSAVDSHTARFLYEHLFLGPLMQHRTVVLVTHHVELVLPGAYYLVRMVEGRVEVQGVVKELRSRGLLESVKDAESPPNDESEVELKRNEGGNKGEDVELRIDQDVKTKKARKLIKDEERETGSVKWSIYKTYIKASSYSTWVILLTIVLVAQVLGFTERYWVMVWGEAYENTNQTTIAIGDIRFSSSITDYEIQIPVANTPRRITNHLPRFSSTGIRDSFPPAQESPFFYVAIYALIGLATVTVNVCFAGTQYMGALRASRNLFKRLLTSVVHATMRWQDITPAGRMLNRFSKDVETVDMSLPSSLQSLMTTLANFASSIIIIVVVFPLSALPACVFAFLCRRVAIGYLNTSRDLRRMESTTRSPIFSGFGELLEGVVTVRAFSAEYRFRNSFFSKVDETMRMWYTFWMTNRWLAIRFDFLGTLAIFVTTLFALSGLVDAGWAALCITSAMAFTFSMTAACRLWSQLELDLNSVERVVEYLDLPLEPPGIIEACRPPAHWPSSSGPNEDSMLVVDNLVVRYAPELPAVLHGISFSLKARERVGLLGRTGSGKSTLAMSILRFVDPTEGQILIDGVDITSIGVHDLRSRLTFIPQDATLFSGTLRDNLDPFGDYSDEECVDVLYRVHMLSDDARQSRRSSRAASIYSECDESDQAIRHPTSEISSVTAINGGQDDQNFMIISLDTEVSAGGLNFSAGQRQLIAMARALLRQSSVIIMDEATSSVDFETDGKIQATIREEFGNSLLLTVAHRLRTIIDYDRLVVLDQGRVAEFDTPWNLINNEGGIFRTMCLNSGSFDELDKAAQAKAIAG
ncbi:P-loop containing nucleoside triphosphate hydrolase protein [Schizopora paradoxa]|uniref:p-loop containing nucleoside triphosphate hydrolase protein n=1 Tax=Schizopora paradoxa TaxID=27342 RepID=A0A0H2S4F8_9AGAM|nr:P-loop containing nucleoside triphosphate hydrolase protein [Schizopora paradoxa]